MKNLTQIACVDDDPHMRQIIELALGELADLELTLFASGQEALEGLPITRPQLVLLDVMMPGMDGFETLKRMRANPATKNIPVIFVTGRAGLDDRVKYKTAGAAAVISKPINPFALARQVLAVWWTLDEAAA